VTGSGSRVTLWGIVAAAVIARVWLDWTAPLLDEHPFRQTQTALTVYWYLRDGIDLLRPPLPVFGVEHPSIPFEFPLYQAIVAALLQLVGDHTVPAIAAACRAVAFAFHLLAVWPLHRLARRHFGTPTADLAVLLWLVMPYPVFWSTTAMIESLAVAAALLHLDQVERCMRRRGAAMVLPLVLAAAFGAVAATVKITTFVLFVTVAGLLYVIERQLWKPAQWRLGDLGVLVAAGVLPIGAGLAWTAWADAVKAENLIGGMGLRSGRLSRWNFGTWEQRLTPENWIMVGESLVLVVLCAVGTAVFLIGAARALGDRRRALWLGMLLLGPLVFFNLYRIHSYYFVAVLPSAILLLAFGIATLAGLVPARMAATRSWAALAIAAVVVAGVWWELAARWKPFDDVAKGHTTHYLLRRVLPQGNLPHEGRLVLEVAERIRALGVGPGLIVVAGNDWSPDIAFYAERPAIMVAKSASHVVGACNDRTWDAIRRARPVVFVKLRPSIDLCDDAIPVPECTLEETDRYWIGTCMRGTLGLGPLPGGG